ncbi:probable E3 ubiquitin-protein ligase RNF144A isoform X3 [Halyomorpha halys]|uniref:probable E3 ubiquitin-protein ligase RNF144A isoform X3 n=1 Tax=Halyomorpha halys TaxID=286706 RepID=UPI000D0C9301|nr:probable E3 ubiquitin-protein ligase RNF144A isoform X1 [Halyomorpha halys]
MVASNFWTWPLPVDFRIIMDEEAWREGEMRSGGETPPPERAGLVKSWYGYGALAEEEESTASASPAQQAKDRIKWRSSLALGSILSRWSRSRIDLGSTEGMRKCHTVLTLSQEPMKPVNRLRHGNFVCSRCSSLLSMASSSKYSITAEGNYVQVGKPEPAPAKILCKLCLSQVNLPSTWTLQCGCTFCTECMKAYVEFEIAEGAYEISCPDALCEARGVLSLQEIENLVNADTMEKHKKFRRNREVDQDVRLAWCPSAGCETVCSVSPGPSRVSCPTCRQEFCSLCRGPWHPSGPCPQAIPGPPGIPFDSELIKCCPMCAVPIEKDEGCAQMMCKRCKHVFCWYCLASLDDDFLLRHYDKGPCKNKLGHSRASVIWHRTQVIGIFAGFGILLLVASPLLLLAAPCIVCCKCRVCTGGPKLNPEDEESGF